MERDQVRLKLSVYQERMFGSVLRSSTTRVIAGAAAATLSGSAVVSANNTSTTSRCDEEKSGAAGSANSATVMGLLQDMSRRVSNIELVLGGGYGNTGASSAASKNHGIDIVLGAQWGDEGKGKLVDMLSQVCASSSSRLH